MGQRFKELHQHQINFIESQKIFFAATAASDGRINVSPKGMDSLRVVNPEKVVWLNVTGSGNETSSHVQEHPRMTIMWASFEGKPMILRIYGNASVVHRYDREWEGFFKLFEPLPGARQIFVRDIDLVQTSCGMGVPLFEYIGERNLLEDWAVKKGEEGIKEYWRRKNSTSLDGKETNILPN